MPLSGEGVRGSPMGVRATPAGFRAAEVRPGWLGVLVGRSVRGRSGELCPGTGVCPRWWKAGLAVRNGLALMYRRPSRVTD